LIDGLIAARDRGDISEKACGSFPSTGRTLDAVLDYRFRNAAGTLIEANLTK
jgi:hypothetical protein